MAVADLAPGKHATSVRDHWWWRPGWHVGRRFYAFHCTFEDQPDLHRYAAAYREALSTVPTTTLVPDRWLHLTLQGVGFCDQVPTATLDTIASGVTARLDHVAAIETRTDGIVVADEAIAIPLAQPEPVRHLRTAIRTALGPILGDDQVPDDPDRFRPHISVGYITAAGSAQPYLAALHDTNPRAATVRIQEVSLIRMHRDHRMYEWETVDRIPLHSGPLAPRVRHYH